MPYGHRITFSAGHGAGVALRALLEAQTKARKEAGYRCALGQIVYGSDWPQFDLLFQLETLGDLEKLRNDPPPAAFQAQVVALTARPPEFELLRNLLPVPQGPNPAFTTRTVLFPVTGKIVALREAIVANAIEEQAEGARIGVATGHAGAPRVLVTRLFGSLADMDDIGPRPNEARAARIAGLFASPPVTQIRQVIVGFN